MNQPGELIKGSKDGADGAAEKSKDLLNNSVPSQCFGDQANCQAEHRQATIQFFVENLGLVDGFGVVSHGEKIACRLTVTFCEAFRESSCFSASHSPFKRVVRHCFAEGFGDVWNTDRSHVMLGV